jgi:CDP-glucose 4,6-dehydratase
VIGGGDWAEDRLIPDLMRAALEGRAVRIRNPRSIRPWQHVLNPLSGYLVLAQALWSSAELAGGWNFGPAEEDARPVSWIVERIAMQWPQELPWASDPGPRRSDPHEARHLKLDSSRARTRLGWRPRWGLEDGLDAVLAWYRALHAEQNMRAVTLGQIEAFDHRLEPVEHAVR